MPLRRGRIGRPGLLGTMARTAVITGTATATSNAMNKRSRRRSAEQQAYADQQAATQQQAYAQQQAAYAPPQPAPAAAPPVDLVGKLRQLSELHSAGALSDTEFAAAKKQLLS
ncbi:SHOCT domain-containing protein [Nocardia rhizosphaerihabitans]|uniref:SHOCT domain-containing protein n=1 Tax=Nocardia rhizosphaerihabitans TaxID=1691570 RepID=UPI00366ABBE4